LTLTFDQAFENWKNGRVEKETADFAKTWGIDSFILYKSLEQFNPLRKVIIPYIEELQACIDFDKAEKQEAGNQLAHMMRLLNKVLPEWFVDMKQKYS
jgi:type I restriction enzyme R subunit